MNTYSGSPTAVCTKGLVSLIHDFQIVVPTNIKQLCNCNSLSFKRKHQPDGKIIKARALSALISEDAEAC